MIGIPHSNQTIRNAVAIFGSLFNNISIIRKDGNVIPVPIAYGPRHKWLEAQKTMTEDEMFEKYLPRMSYELVAMNYDQMRKLTNKQIVRSQNNSGTVQWTPAPVPYMLDFSLYIETKNLNDGWQIIEQILPFFTPAYTVGVRHFPVDGDDQTALPENEYDMPFVLNAITWTDDWTGDPGQRRVIEWQLEFNTRVWLHAPVMPRSGGGKTNIILDSRAIIAFPPDSDSLAGMNRQSNQAGIETGYAALGLGDPSALFINDSDFSPNVINITDSDGNITKIIRDIDQL